MERDRPCYKERIDRGFRNHSVVAILGPRQCGKTTLAKAYAGEGNSIHYFDLEDPTALARLENPMLALDELEGLIVIDEIQRIPELFTVLRVLVDKHKGKQRYLILGSASIELIKQSSETLAGRIQYIELNPFSLSEVQDIKKAWLRGGFPLSYLAQTDQDSQDWRKAYIKTFLEKDIPQLGIAIPSETLRRFWTMLTAYHGNILNASELGRSLGVAHTTIQNYIDILSGTFMVRQLRPWYENISKRQVKSPKIYFRDSGIFHSLIRAEDETELLQNPKLGASWEGFALEEVIRHYGADPEDCYFWSTHSGAEIDLMITHGSKKLGFEFKYSDKPRLTKSMHIALQDLKLDSLHVIYPGSANFPLADKYVQRDFKIYSILP